MDVCDIKHLSQGRQAGARLTNQLIRLNPDIIKLHSCRVSIVDHFCFRNGNSLRVTGNKEQQKAIGIVRFSDRDDQKIRDVAINHKRLFPIEGIPVPTFDGSGSYIRRVMSRRLIDGER